MKPRIALIGFRATGKSLLGRELAAGLGWSFVDMDDELVASLGMSIQEWVGLRGWEGFRKEESRLLAHLARRERTVVATGGGVVLDPANRATLRNGFEVVWLKADRSTIVSRIRGDTRTADYRPPLTRLPLEEEIETVLQERLTLYETTAGHVIEVDRLEPEEIVERLLEWVRSVDEPRV